MPASRLDPQTHRTIVDAMRLGTYLVTAAEHAGIAESTIRTWMTRGRKDLATGRTTIYSKLVRDIQRAEAQAEVRIVGVIQRTAVAGDWRAGAWWLSHRHPSRWTDRVDQNVRVQVDADEFARVVADLVALADPDEDPGADPDGDL